MVRFVRMLLTSAGMANASIEGAFADLVGRPFEDTAVVVVLTASLAVPGDKRWVINELARLDNLGFRQIDLLDLAVPSPSVETRLHEADVVYALGGDLYHLARTILDRNLVGLFEELLAEKVYVGVSAGSMIFTRHLGTDTWAMFRDYDDDPAGVTPPFGFFDWYVVPHWHSDFIPERNDEFVDRIGREADFPVYFIDDDTAVQVRVDDTSGGDPVIDIVSEGRWRLLES
jgi:dipeptidase E